MAKDTSATALVAQVEQAILKIATGATQSERVKLADGSEREFTALQIDELRRFRNELRQEIVAEADGIFSFVEFQPKSR